MKYVLYMHGGSGNHGCEAIVRTTAKLLGNPEDITLWSKAKEEDLAYGLSDVVGRIESGSMKRFSRIYFDYQIRRRLLREHDADYQAFLKGTFKNAVGLSIGGDNYCYPWSAKEGAEKNREIRKYSKATVLWGCSMDEAYITPEVREDLQQFDLITAREQLSYRLLKEINPHTIQVADPAFLLEKLERELPEGFLPGHTVGINISPLIMDYSGRDMILQNYEKLIAYILQETDMNICLIPHVIWDKVSDLSVIDLLYEKYKDTKRICRVEDADCRVLKGYIARCRFFIGARTHATIAAYSTCVPTLVVGYSVKSRGIALDLFGTTENYVVSVQEMKNAEDLLNAFRWLSDNEESVRAHLQEKIPAYVETARVDIGKYIK